MTTEEFQLEATSIRGKMISIACRYIADEEAAEDVVQDVMLKLWQMCDQLQSPIAPLASVIVRNLCLDKNRRQHPSYSIPDDIADEHPENVEHQLVEKVMSLIDQLPDMQQLIMRLRHLEGMEYSEIARLTGSSEPAIRKALSRARLAIRKQYLENYQKEIKV